MTATVDPSRCVGCSWCFSECVHYAITMGEVAEVDSTRCTGCGACAAVCVQEAITVGE